MVRSFFNLLLAAILLANQVELCLGHAHVGQTANGNTVRLHFHLDGNSHSHSHPDGHSHRESDSDSQSGNHDHSQNAPLDDVAGNDALQVPFDHDDDACYLTHSDAVFLTPNRDSVDFSFYAVWNSDSAETSIDYPAGPAQIDRPGALPRRQCAILSQTSRLLL